MAFIPLPNGVRVAMEFTKNGQLVVNVYHVTTAAPITTVNLTALAQVFRDWWTSNLKTTSVIDLALARVIATDLSVPNGLQVTSAPALPEPGTVNGPDTPNNVALAISWRTGFSGRSFRGRTYFAGLTAADVQSNFIAGGRQTSLTTAFTALRTNLTTAGYQLVVASFYADNAPREVGVATPVNSLIINNVVDTQRRRLPGAGA